MTISSYLLFNEISSADMGLILSDKDTGSYELKRVSVQIPYSNKPLNFDFSDIYGKQIYDEVKIVYTLTIHENTELSVFDKYRKVKQWLLGCGIHELTDSSIRDYHYNARCLEVSSLKRISKKVATFTATFTANPFMISKDFGETIWDNIVFDTDNINLIDYPSANTAQGATYEVYNFSKNSITPKFTVAGTTSAGLNCYLNSIQHAFTSDVTDVEVDGFTLKSGKNILHLQGVGTLAISMIEEVL